MELVVVLPVTRLKPGMKESASLTFCIHEIEDADQPKRHVTILYFRP